MASNHAQERFVHALYEPAVGTGQLSERVSAAWTELLPLRREDLPTTLQEAYAVVEAELLAAPDDPASLSDELAAAAATRVFQLAVELLRSRCRHRTAANGGTRPRRSHGARRTVPGDGDPAGGASTSTRPVAR